MDRIDDKEIKETVVTRDPVFPHVVKTVRRVKTPGQDIRVVDQTTDPLAAPLTAEVIRSEVIEEPVIKTEHPQKVFEKKKTILRANQVIWTILAIVEILLGFRVTLKALGASPISGFVNLVYALSQPLAAPFSGILRTDMTAQGSVFEWSTIIGALVYALIAYGIAHFLIFTKPITPEQTAVV